MKYQYESNGNGSEDLGIGKTVCLDLIMVEEVFWKRRMQTKYRVKNLAQHNTKV